MFRSLAPGGEFGRQFHPWKQGSNECGTEVPNQIAAASLGHIAGPWRGRLFSMLGVLFMMLGGGRGDEIAKSGARLVPRGDAISISSGEIERGSASFFKRTRLRLP